MGATCRTTSVHGSVHVFSVTQFLWKIEAVMVYGVFELAVVAVVPPVSVESDYPDGSLPLVLPAVDSTVEAVSLLSRSLLLDAEAEAYYDGFSPTLAAHRLAFDYHLLPSVHIVSTLRIA